jgi:hypothetical protein
VWYGLGCSRLISREASHRRLPVAVAVAASAIGLHCSGKRLMLGGGCQEIAG